VNEEEGLINLWNVYCYFLDNILIVSIYNQTNLNGLEDYYNLEGIG
jgi:hypothetical protein